MANHLPARIRPEFRGKFKVSSNLIVLSPRTCSGGGNYACDDGRRSFFATATDSASPGGATAMAEIVNNKSSKKYQLPHCAGYDKVSEKSQVKFSSVEEAENA